MKNKNKITAELLDYFGYFGLDINFLPVLSVQSIGLNTHSSTLALSMLVSEYIFIYPISAYRLLNILNNFLAAFSGVVARTFCCCPSFGKSSSLK